MTFSYPFQPRGSSLKYGYRKCSADYVGPLVIFECVSLNQFILMSLDGKIYPFLIEELRHRPATVRTNIDNVTTLPELK